MAEDGTFSGLILLNVAREGKGRFKAMLAEKRQVEVIEEYRILSGNQEVRSALLPSWKKLRKMKVALKALAQWDQRTVVYTLAQPLDRGVTDSSSKRGVRVCFTG